MPESLGKILKRIRESKNFSIEEVSERSRIPKYIVSIIEEDRLNEIKSGFYAKSFVKTYAVFLEALNESCVKEYLAKGSVREPQKKPEAVSRPAIRAGKITKIDFSITAKYKKRIAMIVISAFLFWALFFVIGQAAKFIKNRPVMKQQSKVVKKSPERKAVRIPEKEKAAKEAKKEPFAEKSEFVELELSASDNTWLQVIGDGELMFTGLFKKGGKDIWKAKKEIKLEAGNSGVIKIKVNGKPCNFSGKKGEKKEAIITKDGIK